MTAAPGARRTQATASTQPRRTSRRRLVAAVFASVLAGCGGPSLSDPVTVTPAPPTPSPTPEPPTAAVGQTVGAPCESGRLRFADLPLMDEQWQDGLAVARGRALDWQADAMLVELRVACGLFEPGFRWQATYYSRDAQALYATDTAEVVPVNLEPQAFEALREEEIDFKAVQDALADADFTDDTAALESITLLVGTRERSIGPTEAPEDTAIAHVRVQSGGRIVELYLDVESGRIYQFRGDE